jgi:hypothetical protein
MILTDYICLTAVIILVAYDILAATLKIPTISQRCWRVYSKYPALVFAAGFLCGHLFWKG